MSDAAVLGCLAAREALTAARAREHFAPEAIGLYAATGLAAASVNDVRPMIEQSIDEAGKFSCKRMGERGLVATNPLLSFRILANMPPCLVPCSKAARARISFSHRGKDRRPPQLSKDGGPLPTARWPARSWARRTPHPPHPPLPISDSPGGYSPPSSRRPAPPTWFWSRRGRVVSVTSCANTFGISIGSVPHRS